MASKVRIAHEALPRTSCQNRFWVVQTERGMREVEEQFPGAVCISCGRCFACQLVRKYLIMGRMYAEEVTSSACAFLTLTYGPAEDGSSPEGARLVVREHIAKFCKSLRKRYGDVQYCGVPEAGGSKGRVHWHIAVFFRSGDKVPGWVKLPANFARDHLRAVRAGEISTKGEFTSGGFGCRAVTSFKTGSVDFFSDLDEWPHGFVGVRAVDSGTFSYLAKYMMKGENAGKLDAPGRSRMENDGRGLTQEVRRRRKRLRRLVRSGVVSEETIERDFRCGLIGEKERAALQDDLLRIDRVMVVRSHKLGYDFIREEGERVARAGLELRATYRVGGSKFTRGYREGQHREHVMTRGMKRVYTNAYLATKAKQLRDGEIKRFVVNPRPDEGSLILTVIDNDSKRDPEVALEKFFANFGRHLVLKNGKAALPYVDVCSVRHALGCADGGMVVKTAWNEYVFMWADLSGGGRDLAIPIQSRRELVLAVRMAV